MFYSARAIYGYVLELIAEFIKELECEGLSMATWKVSEMAIWYALEIRKQVPMLIAKIKKGPVIRLALRFDGSPNATMSALE